MSEIAGAWGLAALSRLVMAASLLAMPALSAAQAWPQRPIRIVIPYGPGSSPDVLARILGERLTPRLGQPVLIENRAGAGGNVGTGHVAKAAPDGYTFVISTNGPLVNNTVLYRKLPYDPFKELAPVALAGGQANVCTVRSDAGIQHEYGNEVAVTGRVLGSCANLGKHGRNRVGTGRSLRARRPRR